MGEFIATTFSTAATRGCPGTWKKLEGVDETQISHLEGQVLFGRLA